MTSANVIEYTIFKNDEQVGSFRKNCMCRLPEYSDLLKHQPLEEHSIEPWGYDENDEVWYDEEVNLHEFLFKMKNRNKKLKKYFDEKNKR